MPVYAYKCDVCGTTFEKTRRLEADVVEIICPNGHAQIHRVYYAPTVIFKGSGFYINDSRRNPLKGTGVKSRETERDK